MIDWSDFILPVLLGVAGSFIAPVLAVILIRIGVFHNFLMTVMIFTGSGAVAGFAIGLRLRRGRPPLKPSTKTGIRLTIGAIFVVTGVAQALLDLFRGAVSWQLVEPTAGILVGLYFVIPSLRLSSAKSVRMLLTAIAGIATILYFASDYAAKKYSDIAVWFAIGCVVFFWTLIRQRNRKRPGID